MVEHKYVLMIDGRDPRANFAAIAQYMRDSIWVTGWANHLPFMFLVKSNLDMGDLSDKLNAVIAPVKHMLFKIDPYNTSGFMPKPTWDWVNEVPPPQPASGLLSLSDYLTPQPGQTFSYSSLLGQGLLDPPAGSGKHPKKK